MCLSLGLTPGVRADVFYFLSFTRTSLGGDKRLTVFCVFRPSSTVSTFPNRELMAMLLVTPPHKIS